MEDSSDLSYIEIKDASNPATLFNEWVGDAKKHGINSLVMNLATATRNGKVSNRTVVVREILPGASLAFTAQQLSNKVKDINENPQVATTVLLIYDRNGEKVSRQVRFSGIAEQLSPEHSKAYFEKERLAAKIRTWICRECKPTDWDELKTKHDALLKEVVENKKVLDMPESQLAFKVVPNEMDFYSAIGETIADRILFTKDDSGKWHYERIMT